MTKKKKLLLIDANALIHRAYHALPPLTTKKGELVNAVYGFTSVLLNVMNRFEADYIAAAFDLKEPTFRHKEFKGYKATRVKAPDDLYKQIPKVKEVVKVFNIPVVEKKGFEADDLIATFSRQVKNLHPDTEVIIVTGDLDALQLVDNQTKVFALRRGMSDSVLYDEEAVKKRYELAPKQMIDYKGLRGDPSDNLPGVKGVGEKTAIELLKKYKNIEGVYKNLSDVKEGVRKKLEKGKIQAFFSKKLARLVTDAPVDFDLEKCRWNDFDRVKAINLLRQLEFFSLLRRLPGYEKFSKSQVLAEEPGKKLKEKIEVGWKKVSSGEAPKVFRRIRDSKKVSLVTDGWIDGRIRGIAAGLGSSEAFYIAFDDSSVPEEIKKVLEDGSVKKIGYDLKMEYRIWQRRGAELNGLSFDVMLAAYLLDPGTKINQEDLVLEHLNVLLPREKDNSGQAILAFRDEEKEIKKLCRRAAYNFALSEILEDKLEQISREQFSKYGSSTLKDVFHKIEMPLVKILGEMERAGVRINKIVLEGISKKLERRVKTLEKEIHRLAGEEFNVNSSQQLREILFEKLKISTRDIKKGKTGYSTASSELQKIRAAHPVIEKIEEYRELFKLKTTYLDTLPNLTDKNDRLHTTFNQAVTATGRLSSSDPNLQNIPIRTDLGQIIRMAFEAEGGYRLVSADYSQIELRIAAHLSGDVKMITTFINGEDIHLATAARVNKVPLEKVTDRMRSAAKALNFGIIYGMSTFGFAQSAGVGREEAQEFIRKYFENYPQVSQYLGRVKEQARELGYVETELGRRRYLPEINSSNVQLRAQAERMAVNMPIQGLAADIIKLAMIEADKALSEFKDAKMVLQIHDELLFEVSEKDAERFSRKIKNAMENVYKLSVPLVVDVKIGDNWGEI